MLVITGQVELRLNLTGRDMTNVQDVLDFHLNLSRAV